MESFHRFGGVAPKVMSLELLKEITNNFSKERVLGRGTFGTVYKGVQDGEEIAVKLLHLTRGQDDLSQFMKEFDNLRRLRHQNVVQLLGYCYEIKSEFVDYGEKLVRAENIYRALCFEYLHNRSLQRHLNDEYHGLDWQTRYKIIKGTCEGLKYLHEGLESPMYHLDLKPENILLDKNMEPKLADFGLSKLVNKDQQTEVTQNPLGTMGYLPPESIEGTVVSNKFDIFSLGVVMIRIITGYEGYHKKSQMSSQEFIEFVHDNWRNRLQATLGYSSLEADCHQVRRCVEIALDCIQANRHERPTIGVIIRWLNQLEHTVDKMALCLTQQLKYGPSEMVCRPIFTDQMQSMDMSAAPSKLQRNIVAEGERQSSAELSEDKTIKVGSNATSNAGGPSLDNHRIVSFTPQSQGTGYNVTLYMHQTVDGPNHNQVNIANLEHPHMFGCTNVHDYPIYDSLGPRAKIVARAQGLHSETSMDDFDDCWFHWCRVEFSDERFPGSSFMAIGNQNKDEGEWVIVGGTGFFTFAQGTITIRTEIDSGSSNIKEICICAFGCTGLSTPVQSETYKDNMIDGNECSPSTANPHSGYATPQSLGTEYNQIWYMHQIISGPNHNQVNIADTKQPQAFGFTNVHDYPIYDSLGPGKKIVARVQDLHTKTSMSGDGWFHWSKVAFDYERFQGSSFNAIGNQEGEWAIVGGTGDFTFAQGTVTTSRVRDSGSSNIKKICIRAFCCPTNTPIGAKAFKDKITNIDSSATSNMPSRSMPKQGSGPVTLQSLITEYNRILYMHQIINGPDYNQVNIADPMQPNAFGYTNVHDYPMYDRLGPGRKLVARAQGLHTKTSMKYDGWFHWSSIVFSDERFQQGSSFKVIGNQEGEWAIVGGTGAFTFAQGTITTYRIQDNGFSNIKEICIHALCYTKYYSK